MSVFRKDDLRVCPLDASHVIKSSKYITHVHKCARSKRIPVYECPFNKLHLFAERSELSAHIQYCPSNCIGNGFPASALMPNDPVYLSSRTSDSLNGHMNAESTSDFYLTPAMLLPAERKAFYKAKQKEYLEKHPECDMSSVAPENEGKEVKRERYDRIESVSYPIDEWPLSEVLGEADENPKVDTDYAATYDMVEGPLIPHKEQEDSSQPTSLAVIESVSKLRNLIPLTERYCYEMALNGGGIGRGSRILRDIREMYNQRTAAQQKDIYNGLKPMPKKNAFQLKKYGYEDEED